MSNLHQPLKPATYPVACRCGDLVPSLNERDRGRLIDHDEHLRRLALT
jgi:hypothetical protein